MQTILKIFIKFVTILLLLYVWFSWPRGTWDPIPPKQLTPPALEGKVSATGPPGKGPISLDYQDLSRKEGKAVSLRLWPTSV